MSPRGATETAVVAVCGRGWEADTACVARGVERVGRGYRVLVNRRPPKGDDRLAVAVRPSGGIGGWAVDVTPIDAGARPRAAAPPAARPSAPASCVAAFDSMVAVLRRDHPGYRDRVAGRETIFAVLLDSARATAATAAANTSYAVCIPALQRVTAFFRDAHLLVWQGAAPAPPAPPAQPAAPGSAAPDPVAPADDPDRPALRRHDARTLVLRLPDLTWTYKREVDSLVAANHAALTGTPTLVVDLRGNGGGCTCTYDALMPLVATGPVRGDALDVWTSAANVAWFRALAADTTAPDALRAEVRRVLPRLEASPNTLVPWDTAADVYTPAAVLPRPERVAVLVDSMCASSCEDFVRAARQSRKAVVFSAANTAGAGDYGNVRKVSLPGWRQLRVATSRAHRLTSDPSSAVDFVGLAPDVRLPRDSARGEAAVAFAVRRLRAARR